MLRSIEWGVFEYKRIPVTGRLEEIGEQLNIIRNKIDKIKREVGGLPKNNRYYIKRDKEIERMIVERKGLVAEQESLGQCRAELEISRTNKEYKKIAIDIANKYGLFDENHPGSDTAIDIFNELGS